MSIEQPTPEDPATHPFVERPHRTLLALAAPVLLSLIAEPLTGLVDTAFVSDLGSVPLAALGVGTAALSSVFWIFNFLGIGTQTEVAQASGEEGKKRAARITGLGLVLSGVFGLLLLGLGWIAAPAIGRLLGAETAVLADAVAYMRVRLIGAPAQLAILTAFGAMRGEQDMNTPLKIAVTVNILNAGLDYPFIFGPGPLPAWGVAGAAAASITAQWLGAVWAVAIIYRRLGWPRRLRWREASDLLKVGGDLFIRTGALTAFLLLTTRVATRVGADSGAAHQAIRQFWSFSALGLDALALTGQSLVGYFMGRRWVAQARRVALIGGGWSLVLGVLVGAGMWAGEAWLAGLLVPATAVAVFHPAWLVSALVQPINALAFLTDGVHWGTGDYRFLRNAVLIASGGGVLGLLLIDETAPGALTQIWIVSGVWITIRAFFGVARIWPGIGDSPFAGDAGAD
jgi:MATE family multidrug resistance protein